MRKFNLKSICRSILLLFLILISIEMALNIISIIVNGVIYPPTSINLNPSNDTKIILCLGDSVTYGLEGTKGNSYPDQLSVMLRNNRNTSEYHTINLGKIGENSKNIADKFKKYSIDYRPALVVFLAGVNNRWNLSGRKAVLNNKNEIVNLPVLLRIAMNLKIIKLVKIIKANISYYLFQRSQLNKFIGTESKNYKHKKELVSRLMEEAVKNRDNNDFRSAAAIYAYVKKIDPLNINASMELRHNYLNLKGKYFINSREEILLDSWLREDISAIAQECQKKNIILLILTYPTISWQDNIRFEVAKQYGAEIIDFYKIFRKQEDISDLLGKSGGHPNDAGYRLMASVVYKKILNLYVNDN